MAKKLKIIFGVGVPLGLLMAVLKNALNIEDDRFWRYYAIGAAIAIFGAILINLFYQLRLVKKLKAVTNHAKENQDYDLLIREMEQMLATYKGKYSRSLFKMNICYALAKKKQYAEGLELLNSLDVKTVKGLNKLIFYLNQVYFYFYLDNLDEVIRINQEWGREFAKFEEHPQLGEHVAANRVYLAVAQGQLEQAWDLLAEAERKWTDRGAQEEQRLLKEKLGSER
ncbi:hypothetical protein Ami103574_07605 [Aminipila butyrica]|uniref:Tetratricopeptide repeat n=1 Tax=Aminipila butyrica TaxID=433296 RepID=A0A858BVU9_9FIRM|nr:hypothetical protein [Aminipila butyrica]QIB69195.1 hypothetical protein Ami103574_07605 [Aminipila butyrica]